MHVPRRPSSSTILQPSADGWLNSTLQAGFDDWRSYAYCYWRAADELALRFPMPLDSPGAMFLPILYLYRHYVEASLKGILAEAAVAYSATVAIPTHHRLVPIWDQVREHFTGKPGVIEREWFHRAGRLIRELDRVDPESMHFRYPVDKDGERLLVPGFTVSTPAVREAMSDLQYVLENLGGYLAAIADFDDKPPATA